MLAPALFPREECIFGNGAEQTLFFKCVGFQKEGSNRGELSQVFPYFFFLVQLIWAAGQHADWIQSVRARQIVLFQTDFLSCHCRRQQQPSQLVHFTLSLTVRAIRKIRMIRICREEEMWARICLGREQALKLMHCKKRVEARWLWLPETVL